VLQLHLPSAFPGDNVFVHDASCQRIAAVQVGQNIEVRVADPGRIGRIPAIESEPSRRGDAAGGYVFLVAIAVNIILVL
jgi:hypothetical protein